MRHARKVVTSALGGGLVVVACVVPDVELVDRLPGGGSAGSSGATSGTGGRDGEGGDPTPSGGDNPTGGSKPGTAGDESMGGTAGSAGTAGTAGSGGSAVMGGPFPAPGVCDSNGSFAWCEPFNADNALNDWLDLNPAKHLIPCEGDECPSGDAYLLTGFDQVTPDLNLAPDLGAKLSFWARFDEDAGDKVFISFEINGGQPVMFGREGMRYRWRYGTVATGERSAPESDENTTLANAGTWACIELVHGSTRLSARVVPYGEAPVVLPDVDFEATPGEDDAWVTFYPDTSFDFSGNFFFGNSGSSVLIDDIAIGTVDSLSTCDYYLQKSQ